MAKTCLFYPFFSNLLKLLFFKIGLFALFQGFGKCPDRDSIYRRLIFLTGNSSQKNTPEQLREQLKELSRYEEEIKACNYEPDSTFAFLLQRIGAISYKQGQYLQAVKVTGRSINVLTSRVARTTIAGKLLIKNYYNLSVYYASLNSLAQKLDAYDSCITIAARWKLVDYIWLYALVKKVEYLFDIGDFDRCIQSAIWGEKITGEYINGEDSLGYVVNFLVLKVNSLKSFKKYDEAKSLLFGKIRDCKNIGATQHLGTIYELLAEVDTYDGDIRSAEFNFKQAIKYDAAIGFNLGCMQTMNNIGYNLYQQHYKNNRKALDTYKKALAYKSKVNPDELEGLELLNIFGNIANIYVYEDQYDSADYYFKLASNELGIGLSGNDLTNNLERLVQSKKIAYVIALIIDKGDAFLH